MIEHDLGRRAGDPGQVMGRELEGPVNPRVFAEGADAVEFIGDRDRELYLLLLLY